MSATAPLPENTPSSPAPVSLAPAVGPSLREMLREKFVAMSAEQREEWLADKRLEAEADLLWERQQEQREE